MTMLNESLLRDASPPDANMLVGDSLGVVVENDAAIEGKSGYLILLRNIAASVGRLLVASLVALVLPAYLIHRLPSTTYSAWVLVLQLSGYVAYLDFGVQSAISKYVSEYEARKDSHGASVRATAGLTITLAMALIGVALSFLLAWRVPYLFQDMPHPLYRSVRISLICVGSSLSFGLFCSAYSAIFLGLQRYSIPMLISILNRLLFVAAVCVALSLNKDLASMGLAVATVNVVTGVVQIAAWKKLASRIEVSRAHLDMKVLRQMLAYCSVLAIWSVGMLCVNGLDVTIVGKYDYAKTGYFSVAELPINFMIAIIGAALGPLLPISSAMSVHRTSTEMGTILARATRYTSLLSILSGIPLVVLAYPILQIWVGTDYALQTTQFLRILVLANIVRMLFAPYSTMLVATENQRVAVAAAVTEAIVNLGCSVYFARRYGAIGVAYGTLLGSFASVAMHFIVSMHHTRLILVIKKRQLAKNMLLPFLAAAPSIAVFRSWQPIASPSLTPLTLSIWTIATLCLSWFCIINSQERRSILTLGQRLSKTGG